MISAIRTVRSEMNVPPKAELNLIISDASEETRTRLDIHDNLLRRLARLGHIEFADKVPSSGIVQVVVDEATAALAIGDAIDISKEKERLQKEISRVELEIEKLQQKLDNENFIKKAPPKVVAEQRQRTSEYRNPMGG